MSGLLDFLQSASNAVAGNVAGPVDLIAAGLNRIGVPVGPAPVGGTEWMRRQGLWRDVKQSPASVAGETFGLLGPSLAVAKAPQIAKGLLQMGDNLAAPRTLHPEAGAIVWHGSPHQFSKFDSSKIGTGEGAQAYGHGLYLAESRDVGEDYAKTLASPRNRVADGRGVYVEPSPMGDGTFRLAKSSELGRMRGQTGDATQGLTDYEFKSLASAIKSAKKQGYLSKDQRPLLNVIGEDGKYLPVRKAIDTEDVLGVDPQYAQFIASDPGYLYKVDLPDEAIAKMLDWDKPLSQQAPEVQRAAAMFGPKAGELTGQELYKKAAGFDPMVNVASKSGGDESVLRRVFPKATDAQIAQAIAASKRAGANDAIAAQMLRDAGIPGIRYLDGGSRGVGQGTSNFVVFPGNEDMLKILEINGRGLLNP